MTAVAPVIKLEFQPGGPFFRMITSYMAAICGLLIFRPEFNFDRSVKVGLASKEYPALEVYPQEVTELFKKGGFNLGDVTDSLAYMLINSAYEAVRVKYGDAQWLGLRQAHPELEFFRHVRNAGSHGGTWHFEGGEPKRPATWRGRQVTPQLQGTRLLTDNLKPGDLLVLLWDVEQLLP